MPSATIEELNQAVQGQTAPRRFLDLVAAHPTAPALRSMPPSGSGSGSGVEWNTWTFEQYAGLAGRAAAGLRRAGLQPGERMLLMMRNRPDFHWYDMAAQFLRATPVSIYNSSSPEEVQYLASHAEAEIAVVEDLGFAERLLKVRRDLPNLQRIFVIEGSADGPLPSGLTSADELLDHGSLDLHALAAETDPSDLATLIYTSGTTGPPKGVMISQYNVVYTVEQLARCVGFETMGKKVVSYLPMAHIAERLMSHYMGGLLGYNVHCCPEPGLVSSYLREVRPEILFGVPRTWEKIHLGVSAALAADPERKAQFDEGVAVATEIKAAELAGTITDEQRETLEFLDAIAFAPVRALVGLDEVICAVSGAAPISRPVLEWFTAIGVPLSEIYGMSESSGPMTWSPQRHRPGFVGQAIPACEVVVADDGEVICRGGNVFQGYLKQPEKTAEALVDGWLHSGDIGEIDDEGYVRIVDRKKELIITSGGKNISPANLESALKTINLIGQAAAIGDARKFVSAILVLDPDTALVWARANGKEGATLLDLAVDDDVRAEVQRGVEKINAQFAQVEQIKKFHLVGEEWTADSDLLTPTSKLKRRGVNARYAADIEAMYAGT